MIPDDTSGITVSNISIRAKKNVVITEIGQLIQEREKLLHPSDGFIITPVNRRIKMGTNDCVFKLKELPSVDLVLYRRKLFACNSSGDLVDLDPSQCPEISVRTGKRGLKPGKGLIVGGKTKERLTGYDPEEKHILEFDVTVVRLRGRKKWDFHAKETSRVVEEGKGLKNLNSIRAERAAGCTFTLSFNRARPFVTQPNHLFVVVNTLDTLAEGVTIMDVVSVAKKIPRGNAQMHMGRAMPKPEPIRK